MNRLPLTFACRSLDLAGTLDAASGSSGLLIVSGGNEIRSGAFSGQARLADELAGRGHPVFRFDRRGVGDSPGENRGFRHSGRDIAAALEAFRVACPQLTRVVGFGNCDAASALMLTGGAGFDALVLANPWTFEDSDSESGVATMTAGAIRSRYAAKLVNPKELARLATGAVSFRKLAAGLRGAVARKPSATPLLAEMTAGLESFAGETAILLAMRDATAQAFLEQWNGTDPRISRCEGATHAFVEPQARTWLRDRLLDMLTR